MDSYCKKRSITICDFGSQISQQSPAKTAAYTYDQEGRLITAVVTTGGTTTTEEYRYNWTGIRTAKITDGIETKYLIDPSGSLSQVIAELDSAGNLVTFYTRGAELISLHRTGETRYYQYDANGSVRLLTDGAGAVTDTYTYDAFGNLLGKTGTTVNNYLYTGEQFDANTGFYYLRARYMNPSTGTFISMDPAQGSIFDPVSLHKYLYANANPVMNCDPSGRNTDDTLIKQSIAMTISAMLDSAYLACQATAIALFNSLSASLLGVMIGLTPLAMFVANNPAFTDLCMRAANGEISFDGLREFLKDLYYRIEDQVSDWVDRKANIDKSGSSGNTPPPKDPLDFLSRTQRATVEKVNNIINDHLTERDFEGTLRDLQGDPVPNGSGGFWNHLQEMKDSYTGLINTQRSLQGSLSNPNLTNDAKAVLQSSLDTTRYYISRIEELFAPFGGVN